MQNSLNVINTFCAKVEKGFNMAGCIPVIGITSAAFRIVAGKTQFIAGVILGASSLVGMGIVMLTTKNEKQLRQWQDLTLFSASHVVHGALNCLRGTAEFIVGCSFGGYGNIVLIVPNLLQDDPFTPVYNYPINHHYVARNNHYVPRNNHSFEKTSA